MAHAIQMRTLGESDPPVISAAFQGIGWGKPAAQYERYLSEQAAGGRLCLVAAVDGHFAGYVTVNWTLDVPEIQDLNVIPEFRRRGIGTLLLDAAEAEVARRSDVVAIGVGLHPGYNAAQRLYVKRGYIPDGRGVTYRGRYVEEGMQVVLDDDLILHFTKRLAG